MSENRSADQSFDGDKFLGEIRSELERIARAQETLSRDVERVTARLAGRWPKDSGALPDSIQWALNSGDGVYRP